MLVESKLGKEGRSPVHGNAITCTVDKEEALGGVSRTAVQGRAEAEAEADSAEH